MSILVKNDVAKVLAKHFRSALDFCFRKPLIMSVFRPSQPYRPSSGRDLPVMAASPRSNGAISGIVIVFGGVQAASRLADLMPRPGLGKAQKMEAQGCI